MSTGHRIKRHAGIVAGQHLSQALHILIAGMVLAAQLHLDVGVGRANRRGRGIRKIQGGIGQADVVEDGDKLVGRNLLADRGFDLIAEGRRLFDAHASVGANVDHELAGVNRGKKVLPQERG